MLNSIRPLRELENSHSEFIAQNVKARRNSKLMNEARINKIFLPPIDNASTKATSLLSKSRLSGLSSKIPKLKLSILSNFSDS